MPQWYPLMRAARYLGVAVWELAEQPIWWRERALVAEAAEAAHRDRMQKASMKKKGLGQH